MAALIPDEKCTIFIWNFFFWQIKTYQAISVTSAATYKVMKPQSKCHVSWELLKIYGGWWYVSFTVFLKLYITYFSEDLISRRHRPIWVRWSWFCLKIILIFGQNLHFWISCFQASEAEILQALIRWGECQLNNRAANTKGKLNLSGIKQSRSEISLFKN